MKLTQSMREKIVQMLEGGIKEGDYLTDNYEVGEELGKGGYGVVYLAKIIGDNIPKTDNASEEIAMKRMDLKYEEDYSDGSITMTSQSDKETLVQFLKLCQEAVVQCEEFRHPNIVRVYDKWIQYNPKLEEPEILGEDFFIIVDHLQSETNDLTDEVRQALVHTKGLSFYLTMDLYDQDLKTWLAKGRKDMDEENVREKSKMVYDHTVNALQYIHNQGYIHTDLKPSNILVKSNDDDSITAAITDFGECKLIEEPKERTPNKDQRLGTRPYNFTPESVFSDKFDMFSFGLIIYQLCMSDTVTATELGELANMATKPQTEILNFLKDGIRNCVKKSMKDTFYNMIIQCLQQQCCAADWYDDSPWL